MKFHRNSIGGISRKFTVSVWFLEESLSQSPMEEMKKAIKRCFLKCKLQMVSVNSSNMRGY